MKLFCVGHKPPVFVPGEQFTHVSPVICTGHHQLIIPDDHYGDRYHGRILSEYTQLFGLAEFIDNELQDEYVYIFQYRKFLSLREGKRVSSNLPYAYVSSANDASLLFPERSEFETLQGRLVVGPAVQLRSIADNYCRHHLVEDLACFVVALSEVAGFDKRRCRDFINCPLLFPSPSLGVMSTRLFIDQMNTLKMAWDLFSENFLEIRPGKNRRVGGYLLERLHSFLLYEEIILGKRSEAIQGKQIIVSDTDYIHANTDQA